MWRHISRQRWRVARGWRSGYPAPRAGSDCGAAGVWVLCVGGVTLLLALSLLTLGIALVSRHRAEAAADLAALAAAERQLTGEPAPCAAAGVVAAAQGARLLQCVVEAGGAVRVVAEVAAPFAPAMVPPAQARSRAGAGPAPDGGPVRPP